MLILITNNTTLTHKIPTNIVFSPKQPELGADHPIGPQACVTATEMYHVPVIT